MKRPMLDLGLAASAALMGLAGIPHCLAMCGACSSVAGGRAPRVFHLGRLLGYAAAGAVVAASVQLLGQLGQTSALLRPVWVLVHVAAFLLGLALLWRGRQPAWLENLGQAGARQLAVPTAALRGGGVALAAPARAGLAGLAWVAWPCGLLQSALLVAALANDAAGGAMVMAVFALASSLGLLMAGAAWQRALATPQALRWAVRLAGGMLAAASAWALGHGLWLKIAAYCFG